MVNVFSLSDDIIDVREMIERIEELEELQELGEYTETPDCELQLLNAIMEELKGYGGDEQWRGDWYPITLVRDSHFQDYAQEIADECGLTDKPVEWPFTCIDWQQAARELRMDYSCIDINGVTYWYR
jgi:hypothetical protein